MTRPCPRCQGPHSGRQPHCRPCHAKYMREWRAGFQPMPRVDLNNTKSDRALALHERGLSNAQIAEILGVSSGNVSTFIKNALKKRERMRAKAEQ